jgi:ADP-heptose:LPS heptosyltransferase
VILFAPFAARAPSLKGQPSPKDYPFPKELVSLIGEDNIVQVGGTDDEQIAPDFRKNLSFRDLGDLILQSQTGICADSFLQHYYWYLGRRAIVLFSISDPLIFGHPENLNLLVDRRFLRPNQFDLYYTNNYKPEAFSPPEQVIEALKTIS